MAALAEPFCAEMTPLIEVSVRVPALGSLARDLSGGLWAPGHCPAWLAYPLQSQHY
jgi:hypothetical protein